MLSIGAAIVVGSRMALFSVPSDRRVEYLFRELMSGNTQQSIPDCMAGEILFGRGSFGLTR